MLSVNRPMLVVVLNDCVTGTNVTPCRSNRPWRGPGHPAAAYVYSEDRRGEHPQTHLRGFRGLLQVDGYAGFGGLVSGKTDDAPRLAFCWAHVRRKFYDIHVATKSLLAEEALRRIAELYTIEAELRSLHAEHRRSVRQQRSRPLVEAMQSLAGRTTGAYLRPFHIGPGDTLRPEPLDGVGAVSR